MVVHRKDVAARAEVSPAVVSYVLNGGPRSVAPATRARVLKAIAELDYRPNKIARSLRINRTMTIGLLVPDMANPFFAELARAIEEAAFAAGYTVVVGNATEDQERQTAYIRTFLQQQVDGLVLVPAHGPVACLTELNRSQKPCVILDRRVEHLPDACHLLVDNRGGAREATRHLLAHGRRRIACIAGSRDIMPAKDRVAGWQDALTEAGLKPTKALIRHAPYGRLAGYRAALDIFAGTTRRRPDAVFVASDEQAFGALRAFAELGIDCPADVAVTSFDGIAAGAYSVPSLTTMAQPFDLLGEQGIALLLARLTDGDGSETESVLPVSLVVRDSCGCTGRTGDEPADQGPGRTGPRG